MMTAIAWAELHAPLFLAGTNLGQKLDPAKRGGIKMAYDEMKRHLYVTFNGKTARVPETSVLSMVEATAGNAEVIGIDTRVAIESRLNQAFDPNAAQVSTPQSHVHAGLGHGQTGQEPPKSKRGNRVPTA